MRIPSTDVVIEISGLRVLLCAADAAPIASEGDTDDLLGMAFGEGAELIAIPAARLGPDFFRLASGLAGRITQRFVNYRLRLAVIGDISGHLAVSRPLRDFVREANGGESLWFVGTMEDLTERIKGAGARR
ncbi:hypothetical protein GGQ86_002618 [Xanthobacter flavus]|uniref:DUF4180 domain-containing protein n=1 Tax=Xanthobacter flavus TaxID=281 RepID=A0A9W6FK27_XANFL|nr:DUF4180 domain-containing protein [Xanthobacter flavus]MDR6334142.1 hypothetical protein [Xanthobacter flavus]GLI22860.1 hypothetical protein XFLAVUS301_25340 [Xanthobacter flavus]